MSRVAIIIPSRGLIFSRTAEEILKNSKDIPHKFFFAHKLPIPDCFERPVNRALLDDNITHILIVEDDMIIPDGTFKKMLDMDKAVVTADYPVTREGRGAVFRDADRRVLFCGTGCILIKREVFDELKSPYFHTRTKWNVKNYGKYIKFTSLQNDTSDGYGLHDINFCFALNSLNIPIHVIRKTLGQRKLIALGKAGSNNGAHDIEDWTYIEKDKRLKEIQSYPVENTGNLVTIMTDSGEVNCTEQHARKLIRAGIGKRLPKKASYIVWGEK